MNYTIERTTTVTNELILEILETASYSIGYWARQLNFASLDRQFEVKFDGDDFEDGSELSSGKATIDYQVVARTIEKILAGNAKVNSALVSQCSEWLNGHPTLDGDLADAIVQIATFGEIIYG